MFFSQSRGALFFYVITLFLRKNALKIAPNQAVDQKCDLFQKTYSQLFSQTNLEALARQHQFIQRNRKLTAAAFVKALVFHQEDQQHFSLLDLKGEVFEHTGAHLSPEALHKRFTPEAVAFLKALLSAQISQHLPLEQLPAFACCRFTGIHIKDSTKFKLPAAYQASYPGYGSFNKTTALMNIQYEYDLLSGQWRSLSLTPVSRNDQADSKATLEDLQAGSLNIRDLGYITTSYLKGVESHGAYYLNRLPQIGVYQYKQGSYQPIDWQALDRKIKKAGVNLLEVEVYLGKREKLKTRMILAPVPEQVANQRVRKAQQAGKRAKGYQLSKQYKLKARYNIYISNVPKAVLCASQLVRAYPLRWQIELVFKTWKSHLHIHQTKAMKKARMECQLLAKLIWILLQSKLLQLLNHLVKTLDPTLGCSPPKFFKRAKKFSQVFLKVIPQAACFSHWFKTFIIPIIPDLIIEQRKQKKTHCQLIYDIFVSLS